MTWCLVLGVGDVTAYAMSAPDGPARQNPDMYGVVSSRAIVYHGKTCGEGGSRDPTVRLSAVGSGLMCGGVGVKRDAGSVVR